MGIGIVLVAGLSFVAFAIGLASWGLRRAALIRNRQLRTILFTGFGLLALAGILPIVNIGLSFLGFYSHPEPIAALAEIFPAPLPQTIQPVAASRENSSDYWSLYIAVTASPDDLATLVAVRGLKPSSERNDQVVTLPTNVRPPAFWPRENCPGLTMYEPGSETFKKLPPPGTWQYIRLLYCPQDQEAFVWAVEVN